jgi:hypothetical protein
MYSGGEIGIGRPARVCQDIFAEVNLVGKKATTDQ